MDKIYLYNGSDIEKVLEKVKSAALSFSSHPLETKSTLKKAESVDGGLSQIKRWISTSSFSLILIEDLSKALEDKKDGDAFLLWLKDHAEDYEGPYVIIKEAESLPSVIKIAKKVDNIDSIYINNR